MANRIKKDDRVVVISGAYKGTEGRVLKVNKETDRILVEGVNIMKRHQSNRKGYQETGIVEREAPIHVSNVMLVDPQDDGPTRIKMGVNKDGKKVRIAAKSGAVLDG